TGRRRIVDDLHRAVELGRRGRVGQVDSAARVGSVAADRPAVDGQRRGGAIQPAAAGRAGVIAGQASVGQGNAASDAADAAALVARRVIRYRAIGDNDGAGGRVNAAAVICREVTFDLASLAERERPGVVDATTVA